MRRIALAMVATSYGLGPFHPAIKSHATGQIWYWPNITKTTEDEAAEWAKQTLQDAEDAAERIAQTWNIFPA
jgi:hypothetical protein